MGRSRCGFITWRLIGRDPGMRVQICEFVSCDILGVTATVVVVVLIPEKDFGG